MKSCLGDLINDLVIDFGVRPDVPITTLIIIIIIIIIITIITIITIIIIIVIQLMKKCNTKQCCIKRKNTV